MIELSASQAPRARACPPSIRTEGIQVVTTPLPALGQALHHMMMMSIQHGQHLEAETVAAMFKCDAEELERLAAQSWHAWQQIRQYFGERPECEVSLEEQFPGLKLSGHVDVIGLAPHNRQIRIADWKTSWQEEQHGDQIRAYATLAFCRWPTGYDEVWAAVIRPRHGTYEAQVYRRDELHSWLAGLTERLTGRGSEQYHVGEQCIRCPRGPSCPAKTAMLGQAISAFLGIPDGRVNLAAEPFSLLYDRIRLIEQACKDARTMIKAEVAQQGGIFNLADGRELVVTEEKRETIKYNEDSFNILDPEIAPDREAWSRILKISNTELKKAIMAQAPRGQKGAAWEATLNQLREAGAVETRFVEKLELRRCQDERTDTDRELNTSDGGATIAPAAEALAGPGARDQPGLGSDQP